MKFQSVVLMATLILVQLSSYAAGVTSLEGTLLGRSGKLFFKPKSGNYLKHAFRVETSSVDAMDNLVRLEPGDSITATGELDVPARRFVIADIDYIGMRRWLGTWKSATGTLTVSNFHTLSFKSDSPVSTRSDNTLKPGVYNYSMTFAPENKWVLFVSNSETTVFATLEFFGLQNATLKINDSETGSVILSVDLSRVTLGGTYDKLGSR